MPLTNVLIVGAGPTGLTAAVELARQGIVPHIIDKRSNISGLSRAVGITPNSLKLLSASGVTNKLLQSGIKVTGAAGYFESKQLISIPFGNAAHFDDPSISQPLLHCLPQDETETVLLTELLRLGGQVQFNTECLSLMQNDDKVTVTTNQNVQHYDYVIGADGIHSAVRTSLGIEYTGYELAQTWSIADLTVKQWQHPNEFGAFLLRDGNVCVVVPIACDRVRVISNTDNCVASLPVPLTIDTIKRQSTFNISIRQAENFSKGRVHLAGDAAHCHSPVGGRGMNLGIADAVQLAACIVNKHINDYHNIRHPIAAKTINTTERARKVLTNDSRIANYLKPMAMRAIEHTAFIKTKMVSRLLSE